MSDLMRLLFSPAAKNVLALLVVMVMMDPFLFFLFFYLFSFLFLGVEWADYMPCLEMLPRASPCLSATHCKSNDNHVLPSS